MEILNLILTKLIEYFPQIAGYSIITIIVVYLTYKITKFYTVSNNVHKEFPEFKKILINIAQGLATLNTVLLEKNVISQSCYSNGNSPRVINELGKKLLNDSGADVLFENMKESLLDELAKRNFQSSLELERESLNLLLARMNEPQFSGIQNFVYEHPNFENTPLSYTDILFMMSLRLRDLYMEKHPEVAQ